MQVVKITNLSKSFNDNLVLDNISLSINSFDKIGIIGKNGCGKSTLIKIVCGDIDDYEGSVIVSDDRIGYLKQITEYTNEDFLNMCTSKEGLSKFLKLNSEFGITKDIDYSTERLKNLSGGEKTKIALSYILSKDPSILIMDEPTNHVDIKSIDYLINIIKNYSGTLIVVSHDRYFLNQTVNKIIEIDRGKINIYNGNYDYYVIEKEKELAKMKSRYENEQKLDKKIKYCKSKYTDYYLDKALKNIDYLKEDCVQNILYKTENILNIENLKPYELSIIYKYIFNTYCPNYNIKINNLFLNNKNKFHFIMISYNDYHYSYNYKKKSFVKVNDLDILNNLKLGKISIYKDELIPNIKLNMNL